jgi:glycine/D-amino acid oxidase-like deaminating enzyme
MISDYRSLSFWHDSVPGTLQARPSLEKSVKADIAIIGAGYTGLWAAWYLKQADPALRVVILEAEIAGFGASGRNGGWCSAYLSGIERWLDDPRQREGALRLQRLMFDAVDEVGRVSRSASIDCHYEKAGALEIAVLPQQAERLEAELRYLRSLGFGEEDYAWMDEATIRGELAVHHARAAIHMKHCAAVHPSRLARGLADAIENAGVALYEQSRVTGLKPGLVRTASGEVRCGSILIATEGYSDSVPGRKDRLIPVHSMMVATEPLSGEQLAAIGFGRRYCFGNLDRLVTYGQVTADHRITFGCRGTYHLGSRLRHFDPADSEFDRVRETLIRFFPAVADLRFSHAWGGAMGVSRNLRPSVNFDADTGLGWAGGYFGNGVGASNLAGRTLADLVTGRETDRTRTPWVNPDDAAGRWEPEPLRWMGIKSRATLMKWADAAEYRDSRMASRIDRTLDYLFP